MRRRLLGGVSILHRPIPPAITMLLMGVLFGALSLAGLLFTIARTTAGRYEARGKVQDCRVWTKRGAITRVDLLLAFGETPYTVDPDQHGMTNVHYHCRDRDEVTLVVHEYPTLTGRRRDVASIRGAYGLESGDDAYATRVRQVTRGNYLIAAILAVVSALCVAGGLRSRRRAPAVAGAEAEAS